MASRENYPRAILEAMAAGVPVVVERDYAFPKFIRDGKTGFLCASAQEMAYRASELAFNEPLRQEIAHSARRWVETEAGDIVACWEPWRRILG